MTTRVLVLQKVKYGEGDRKRQHPKFEHEFHFPIVVLLTSGLLSHKIKYISVT